MKSIGKLPQCMYAINHFGNVFLIVEICKLEEEDLESLTEYRCRFELRNMNVYKHLRQPNSSHRLEQVIDIVGMSELQFRAILQASRFIATSQHGKAQCYFYFYTSKIFFTTSGWKDLAKYANVIPFLSSSSN